MNKLIYIIGILAATVISLRMVAQNVPGQKIPSADDSLQCKIQKAQTLVKEGKKEEASKILTGIMATHSYNKEAVQWWLMANMKRSPTGEVDAIQMLDSMALVYPSNDALLFYKVFIQTEYGMTKEALENQERLIARHPQDDENWIGRGQILYSLERYTEACGSFDKALELNPSRTDVLGMKASALAKLGQYDLAISTLNSSLERGPNNANAIYNRACLYCLKGDKANALADLKHAIELNPRLRKHAPTDEDFKSLWEDVEFIALTK